jgi:hypothetical protein
MATAHPTTAREPGAAVAWSTCWVSDASRNDMFELVEDHGTWLSWADVDNLCVEHEAALHPNGTGRIRRVSALGLSPREKIIEIVSRGRIPYRLLSGLPSKNYVSVADSETMADGQTSVRWSSSCTALHGASAMSSSALIGHVVRALPPQRRFPSKPLSFESGDCVDVNAISSPQMRIRERRNDQWILCIQCGCACLQFDRR